VSHIARTPRRLPLGPRVLIRVGLLLLAVVAVTAVAVVLVVDQGNAERRLVRTSLPYASDVSSAALLAKGVANDERGFLMTGNPRFRSEAAARALAARTAFAAAVSHAATRAQRDAVAAASAGFERWYGAVQDEFRAYAAGSQAHAVSSALGPDRSLRKRYERALATSEQLASRAVSSETSSLATSSSRAVDILLALLAAVLVAGVVLSFWIVRSVLQPVQRLLELIAQADDVHAV
jgi:methyl-accepting chemotaxis protein